MKIEITTEKIYSNLLKLFFENSTPTPYEKKKKRKEEKYLDLFLPTTG